MGVLRRSGNAAILSGSGEKEKVSYCQDCLQVKILSPLRHRIYLDEDGKITNPGPDANKWRQCWTCGLIVGVYEAKLEAELDTITEPRSNPFKFGSGSQVMTGESRKIDKSGKTQRKRKLKARLRTIQRRGRKTGYKTREEVNFVRRTVGLSYTPFGIIVHIFIH
jgi:hypothetical protein